MMRANQHRRSLSEHISGGLVMAGASAYKLRAALAAPDLWSIRALVLEPEAIKKRLLAEQAARLLQVPDEEETSKYDVELALQVAARMRQLHEPAGEAMALARAAMGTALVPRLLLRRADATSKTARLLDGDDTFYPFLLTAALQARTLTLSLSGHVTEALATAEERVSILHGLAELEPQSFTNELADALDDAAELRVEAGDTAGAQAARDEAERLRSQAPA